MERHIATAHERRLWLPFMLKEVRVSYQAIGLITASIEAGLISVGYYLGGSFYAAFANIRIEGIQELFGAGVLVSVLYVAVCKSVGLYQFSALIHPASCNKRIFGVCGVVLLSLTALMFLLKIGHIYSPGALFSFAALMLLTCVLVRFATASVVEILLRAQAITGRAAFVIGDSQELSSVTASYLLRDFGLREVGRIDLCNDDDLAPHRIEEALAAARRAHASELLIASRLDRLDWLNDLERLLRISPLPVRLLPNHVYRSVLQRHTSDNGASVHLVDLQRAPMSVSERVLKRAVDIGIASAAVFILSPILVLIGLLIKLDSEGPAIFKQRRNGFDQREFLIFKFRTMRVQEDGSRVVQATRGDPRVTRIGRILRKTSIDELPQLVNVLRGEMSLVGPRPHAIAHDDEYRKTISDYCLRHHMKPGITGWAQVNGFRGETLHPVQMQSRIDLDVQYVTSWSLMLDFKIILRTGLELLKGDAY